MVLLTVDSKLHHAAFSSSSKKQLTPAARAYCAVMSVGLVDNMLAVETMAVQVQQSCSV
jgi:hypothetical protein